MMHWSDHLIIVPVVLPLITGALLVLVDEQRRRLKFGISLAATFAMLAVALALAGLAHGRYEGWTGSVGVYLAANWPVPFGIALAADRLSALMVVLVAILGLGGLMFAQARWARSGVHFHALLQFMLMGLNGAFLTADLFNLFVFFEVMLAASYGLALHGSGPRRVAASLHYIAVNLVASSLFLIGVSMIYGIAGTLNMADLARLVPELVRDDRMLLEAAAAVLAIAFLVKAAMWPLAFWLPAAYSAASPPAAAVFALTTKVGVYAIMRLWLLVFAGGAGGSTGFGRDWLLYGGMATIVFAAIGMLAAQDLRRLAGYSVIMSSGTMLAAIAFDDPEVLAGALFYLVSATLAASALFLLIELIERSRSFGSGVLAVTLEAFEAQGVLHADAGKASDDQQDAGVIIPAAMAFLGLSFVGCALLMAGLPPLSGFIGKFALLAAVLGTGSPHASAVAAVQPEAWAMLGLVVASGLAAAVATMRIGIRVFWVQLRSAPPRLRLIEATPVAAMLLLCVVLTVQAGPVMRYLDAAAVALHGGAEYRDGIIAAPRVPSPAEAQR
jgi:multicomponent K+:H+ antiporter subunit D